MSRIISSAQPSCPPYVGEDPSNCAVVIDGAVFSYSNACAAIKGISLNILQGEHLVVMGPSGSGKSTFLGCISGRLSPQAGQIECRGRAATIHQDLRLVEERSVLENVLHGSMGRHSLVRTLFRFPKEERDQAVNLLCRVGLCDKVYTQVKRLSGGQKQRVAIARALMQNPDILLADEPISALDDETADEIMRLITDLAAERGLTVITVLHDYRVALRHADRIVRLVDGKVAYVREGVRADGVLQSSDPSPVFEGEVRSHPDSTDAVPQDHPSPTGRPLPEKPSDWRLFPILLVVAAMYFWSVSGLDLQLHDLRGSFTSLAQFLGQLFPSSWEQFSSIPWVVLLAALVETLQMAVVGTTLGVLAAWPLAALAAKNVGPRYLRAAVRFLLNVIRTVPSLIWALLFVAAVGLGTFAGVLALFAYSVGYLSKFFYESFEGVESGPSDALGEIGASGLQRFLHAIWPAARPAVLSSCLFMLEYNVRAASILGIVDAGGIGFYMKQYADFRAFPSLLACLLLILGVVVAFDAVSCRVRERLLKVE